MIRGKVVAAAMLALVLGACQQGSSSSPAAGGITASKPTTEEYVSTKVFEARQNELGYKFAERLLRGCTDSFGSEDEMKACYRSRTLAAFDATGLADKHCPSGVEDFQDELGCIVTGSIGYRFAQDIGTEAAGKFDWSNPEKSVDTIAIDFILGELQKCLGGSSASSPDDCVTEVFVKRLAIPDSDVRLCLGLTDDFKQGQCLGEAYALKFMTAGIEKL